jgi:plasmid stabilization system protein ParE
MRFRWSEEAIRDLARLRTFLRKHNPGAAARAGEKIRAAAQGLERLPELGWANEEEDVRQLVVPFGASGYVIQYRVQDEEAVVARVWHGRENRE